MNIIFAAGHLPASRGRQAGFKFSFSICEYLAQRHTLHLLAFAKDSELAHLDRDDLRLFESSELISVNNRVRLLGALAAPHLPLAIAARHSTQFLGKLRKLVVQTHPDVVIFDHTAMFQYATDLPWPAVTVGNAHDVYTQAWNRKAMRARNPLAHLLLGTESRRMANWEKRICAELDLVLTLNEKDKRLLEELQSAAQVIVVNPRISIPNCDPASVREPGSMLFCGAMDRPENADGVRWAVRSILPAIRLAVPNAKLYVAGSDGERLAHEFAGQEGVTITGFVPDLGRLMSRMEIALLPLRLGAGIKFKTLECMAAGLPTITTSIGAEGIAGSHGIHYLVAESEEEIASHAIELLKNSEARREMGAQAKTFITTTCDFSETMKLVEEALIDAVAKRKTVQNRDPALHSA